MERWLSSYEHGQLFPVAWVPFQESTWWLIIVYNFSSWVPFSDLLISVGTRHICRQKTYPHKRKINFFKKLPLLLWHRTPRPGASLFLRPSHGFHFTWIYIVSYGFKPFIRPVPTTPPCLHSSPAGLLQPQLLQAPSSATGMRGCTLQIKDGAIICMACQLSEGNQG